MRIRPPFPPLKDTDRGQVVIFILFPWKWHGEATEQCPDASQTVKVTPLLHSIRLQLHALACLRARNDVGNWKVSQKEVSIMQSHDSISLMQFMLSYAPQNGFFNMDCHLMSGSDVAL